MQFFWVLFVIIFKRFNIFAFAFCFKKSPEEKKVLNIFALNIFIAKLVSGLSGQSHPEIVGGPEKNLICRRFPVQIQHMLCIKCLFELNN